MGKFISFVGVRWEFMDWIKVSEFKPDKYSDVLVATNLHEDGWEHFFAANYFPIEDEWICHSHFSSDECPYIRMHIKCKKNDKWCYIYAPDDD